MWDVLSDSNEEICKKVAGLFRKKDLHITVDGKTYNLGKRLSTGANFQKYMICSWYNNNAEEKKLGEILKQIGKTKRFCCNWR
ncbi:hypothetical protein [Photorhabdus sp. RM323S]|uniref:DUF7823 domain-containing protein n=1 Tax=Photorhabdus sp. RM323S TaxID=3342828 RepID=UPI0036DC8D70